MGRERVLYNIAVLKKRISCRFAAVDASLLSTKTRAKLLSCIKKSETWKIQVAGGKRRTVARLFLYNLPC